MKPGDVVVFRGAKCELLEVRPVTTPSGGEVMIARIRRPRAGEAYVFAALVDPDQDRPAEPDRTSFAP